MATRRRAEVERLTKREADARADFETAVRHADARCDERRDMPRCAVCEGVIDERGPDICPTGGHCK